jgi:hypothetical protein
MYSSFYIYLIQTTYSSWFLPRSRKVHKLIFKSALIRPPGQPQAAYKCNEKKQYKQNVSFLFTVRKLRLVLYSMATDAGIEPKTVAVYALTVKAAIHQRLHLIHQTVSLKNSWLLLKEWILLPASAY